jgi:MFS family permease
VTFIDVMDVLRIVGLVLGASTISVALVVTATYVKQYRTRRGTWRGLLPRHVVLIGVSYIGLLLWAMEDMMQRFHEDPSWRIPALFVLAALGFVAMWDVLGHQRHRVRS